MKHPHPLLSDLLTAAGTDRDRRALHEAASIAVHRSLRLRPGEHILIISNPAAEVAAIAAAMYDAALSAGGLPVLLFQPQKTQMDFAEPAVIAALNARPEVVVSFSANKLGKDPVGSAAPYRHNGVSYDHLLHLLLYGEKSCRSFWSPATSIDSFVRTVPINYPVLRQRCAAVKAVLDRAVAVHVWAPGGTDITLGIEGRTARADDGDFSTPGSGGNLPAGETFISPRNGTARGRIVFDGSISVHEGDLFIKHPITCTVSGGFVREIDGDAEAAILRATIEQAETNALLFEQDGRLPKGSGKLYAKNARNIGELGIGLNPSARITGNMLEDEKAYRTCHFAIGMNYDDDAPSLIHLDGLVRKPTIVAIDEDRKEITIEDSGVLLIN
jgi:leucyl aminopeptidase (aminopeptidase T)